MTKIVLTQKIGIKVGHFENVLSVQPYSEQIDWSRKFSIKQWKKIKTEKDGKTIVINSLFSIEDSLEGFLKILNLQGIKLNAHIHSMTHQWNALEQQIGNLPEGALLSIEDY